MPQELHRGTPGTAFNPNNSKGSNNSRKMSNSTGDKNSRDIRIPKLQARHLKFLSSLQLFDKYSLLYTV
jgi:hypothetical protein